MGISERYVASLKAVQQSRSTGSRDRLVLRSDRHTKLSDFWSSEQLQSKAACDLPPVSDIPYLIPNCLRISQIVISGKSIENTDGIASANLVIVTCRPNDIVALNVSRFSEAEDSVHASQCNGVSRRHLIIDLCRA